MTQQLTYIEVRDLAEQWCKEALIDPFDGWIYPFTGEEMNVVFVLWRLHSDPRANGCMDIRAMHAYFDRYVDARKQAEQFLPVLNLRLIAIPRGMV
jgi:hypothetical protein